MVAKSPPWFTGLVEVWDRSMGGWLRQYEVPSSAHDLCRTVVYGVMASNLQRLTKAWSAEGAAFVRTFTVNAIDRLPRRDIGAVANIESALWTEALAHIAYPRGYPSPQAAGAAQDGLSLATAVPIEGASNNAAAVAALLRYVTGGDLLRIERQRSMRREKRNYLVLETMVYPLLGSSKKSTYYFEIKDGESPESPISIYLSFETRP